MFILTQELQLYDMFQAQIAACDVQIEQCLDQFADQVDVTQSPLPAAKRRGKKQPGNAPSFDVRTHLSRISGIDFTQVDGLGVLTVLTLLSELGLDASRFPSAKHFASWLGLCPGSRITGGKRKSSKTRQVANRVATALRIRSPNALSFPFCPRRFPSSNASSDGHPQDHYRNGAQTGTDFLSPLDIEPILCRSGHGRSPAEV